MTIQQAAQQLHTSILPYYGNREATLIVNLVMERLTGLSRIDRVMNRPIVLSPFQEELFEKYRIELQDLRPVQYVLGEAWFYGMKLYVDERVLIPRPETEELVEWVQGAFGARDPEPEILSILDIGTGSGCIPLALKKSLSGVDVHGCDTSEGALEVARRNSKDLGLDITLHRVDFLSGDQLNRLPIFDLLVSNPPYVPMGDKKDMAKHVLNYEPHLALFVEDDDPLLFYRAIADFANAQPRKGTLVFVEVHEKLGGAVAELFQDRGATSVVLKKDMQGRDRMVRASF